MGSRGIKPTSTVTRVTYNKPMENAQWRDSKRRKHDYDYKYRHGDDQDNYGYENPNSLNQWESDSNSDELITEKCSINREQKSHVKYKQGTKNSSEVREHKRRSDRDTAHHRADQEYERRARLEKSSRYKGTKSPR